MNNHELTISDGNLIAISREINNSESVYNENLMFINIIRQEYQLFKEDLNKIIYSVNNDKEIMNNEFEMKSDELKDWKIKKEPEPDRDEKITINRKKLSEMEIPFIPFYKAIDFQNNTNERLKGLIEEALLDMGLLDALIIPRGVSGKGAEFRF